MTIWLDGQTAVDRFEQGGMFRLRCRDLHGRPNAADRNRINPWIRTFVPVEWRPSMWRATGPGTLTYQWQTNGVNLTE